MRGLAVAAGSIAAMALYRHWFIEPAAWGIACDSAAPPWACLPRQALFWLQYEYAFGLAALAIGLCALVLRSRWLGVAGVAAGGIAVLNYNATWGMVGAALGASSWVGASPR